MPQGLAHNKRLGFIEVDESSSHSAVGKSPRTCLTPFRGDGKEDIKGLAEGI